MALVLDSEELYGARVEVRVSGTTDEYGSSNTGRRAAQFVKQLDSVRGARVQRKSYGITWDGDSGKFCESFTYLILG